MDIEKSIVEGRTEETAQSGGADKLMEDDFLCIFRERDLLRNQAHNPGPISSLGITGHIKGKVRGLFDNL